MTTVGVGAGIAVRETGRLAPGTDAPELEVDVPLAGDTDHTLLDGTDLRLVDDVLTVRGPRRDVLVRVGGRAVQRASGRDLVFDLWAPRRRVRFDSGVVGAAIEADTHRLPRHDGTVEPLVPGPDDAVVVRVHLPASACGGTVRWTADGSDPCAPGATQAPLARDDDGTWTASLRPQPAGTWVRYAIGWSAADGTLAPLDDAAPLHVAPLPTVPTLRPARRRWSYAIAPPGPPDWTRDAVVYHVLVDRFAGPGGAPVPLDGEPPLLGFIGGTIDGLVARLDHIRDLGATAILVSCLTPADMHVGYDHRSATGVDPRFGTEDDVRRLCDEAHSRGLRVLLDHEASYAGGHHPDVVAARAGDAAAGEQFLRDPESGRLLGWYGGNPTFVPYDHDHPSVRADLLEAARWWLRLGVDGFRLDSAHAAPLDFWAAFGRAVHDERADAFTFGEVTAGLAPSVALAGRLDGFHDFGLHAALSGFVADGSVPPSGLEAVLCEREAAVPDSLARVTFVEGHDSGRLSRAAGGDRRRLLLGLGLLLSLPGTPLLYYGTEVGLQQPSDGDADLVARLPMPWEGAQVSSLLEAVRALVRRRTSCPALRRGRRTPLLADDTAGTWASALTYGDRRAIVVANASERPATVDLPDIGTFSLDPLSHLVVEANRS